MHDDSRKHSTSAVHDITNRQDYDRNRGSTQKSQRTCNVILRRVRITMPAVDKQNVLNIMTVCL